MNEIHQRALSVAKDFKRAEAELLGVLQEVEASKTFLEFGCTSLFAYAVRWLGLSEDTASNFITVARKARVVPELMTAIKEGGLSVSKARKIAPVLTALNQKQWVEKARSLPTRELEHEVARVAPKEAVRERMKYVSEMRLELRVGISQALQEKLKRIQDLESQRLGRSASLEDALEAMAEGFLNGKDPVKRAERVIQRKSPVTRRTNQPASSTIPAEIRHQVCVRDQGQCAYKDHDGKRCESRRWIDHHHIKPKSEGGAHTLENLITLCRAHHRMHHVIHKAK